MYSSSIFLTIYINDINIFSEFENNIIKFKYKLIDEFIIIDLKEYTYYLRLYIYIRLEEIYLY